jgi:acid stress-induced BolA-like protein IbaG/YrbA
MLPTPEQVKQYIAVGLACEHLEVEGDGQHFFATIVSPSFEGKRLIQRHPRAQHEDADARRMAKRVIWNVSANYTRQARGR